MDTHQSKLVKLQATAIEAINGTDSTPGIDALSKEYPRNLEDWLRVQGVLSYWITRLEVALGMAVREARCGVCGWPNVTAGECTGCKMLSKPS